MTSIDLSAFSVATLLDRKRRLEADLHGNRSLDWAADWLEWKLVLEELMRRDYYGSVTIHVPVDPETFQKVAGAITDEE